ncbi:MAG: hypothetical protein WBW48_09350 [Anaerolineae bacterium]
MKIIWQIEARDVERVQTFFDLHQNDPFVQQRIERNLGKTKPKMSKAEFWQAMVSCLLTTQQRSGPDSAVTRFINTKPFPLNYQLCIAEGDLRSFAQEVLSSFGGLRRSNRIADEIATDLHLLEQSYWSRTFEMLDELRLNQTVQSERKAVDFIDGHFKGFGPKQSRNLLQSLRLTKYEIPIDSRITKWLNDFGFPVRLSAQALSDRNYYNFVSEGFQRLCAQSGIYPCVLDAAIFASFDKGGWSEQNIVW